MTVARVTTRSVLTLLAVPLVSVALCGSARAADPAPDAFCHPDPEGRRVVCADVGALDQTLVYNRFGSFNPFGMIFSLDRDLAVLRPETAATEAAGKPAGPDAVIDLTMPARVLMASDCDAMTGAEHGHADADLSPGNVRLRDCKRPRPMVLRANVGDILDVRVTNYLRPDNAPDLSRDWCRGRPTGDAGFEAPRPGVSRGDDTLVDHGEALCPDRDPDGAATETEGAPGWPRTRGVNFVVQGLTLLPVDGAVHDACRGLDAAAPGGSFVCRYRIDQEGTYFLASHAAPAGGEGDGGSLVHGLFGAVVAQREGTRWYRSQVSKSAFDAVWPRAEGGPRHARTGLLDFERTAADGTPLLNMARAVADAGGAPVAQADFAAARVVELVHSDLNAIVYCDRTLDAPDCARPETAEPGVTMEPAFGAFREFTVFFHDELKAFYTRHFEELGSFGQLAGVKDGFAVNYGASGMGSLLLANRKGIGPAADCMECLYEEFFLTSWANGDPALLEWFADDPSNVHHSYLNDPVVFRNFHAGPKETHVFHLHAHQWFAGNDPGRGAYLDSQTVAPQQGFTYNIYHGGQRGADGSGQGWWDTQGSGNRNRTPGDSIFHCHLYPHFAQGMWALWRVHDTLEDGTRKLPDGQVDPGLSLSVRPTDERGRKRPGTVDRLTGLWTGPETGDATETHGTPIPALVPLPGEPLPLLPTYAAPADVADMAEADKALRPEARTPMPGYPFYIPGRPGHRPPQAPLDIARDLGPAAEGIANLGTSEVVAEIDTRTAGAGWLDGGLGRHLVAPGSARSFGAAPAGAAASMLANGPAFDALDEDRKAALLRQVVAKAFALGDLGAKLTRTELELLPNDGTRLERAAMGFHHDGLLHAPDAGTEPGLRLADATGAAQDTAAGAARAGSHPTLRASLPDGSAPGAAAYTVNGSPPAPGAPFADPCGAGGWAGGAPQADPLAAGLPHAGAFRRDPLLVGFRRYEASAVQLNLVVNRAGWHDPQARINVLTEDSARYKDNGATNRISPLTSDTEEPFFFRALSGECIEFRHTNELPKELELDDFQVRTPTDTIGQHIHLVKFDVLAADGSSNGFNYEDGTFAPDELALRICTAADPALLAPDVQARCSLPAYKDSTIWRLDMHEGTNRGLFQTTVQRWFADPILTLNGDPDSPQLRDRTLRTVFTHDHFAPSSIQQHGFYSALLIEPSVRVPSTPAEEYGTAPGTHFYSVCDPAGGSCAGSLPDDGRLDRVAWGGRQWTGAQRRIETEGDPTHPDFREFALSVADFALLYDPRDRTDPAALAASASLGANGLADPGEGPLVDSFGMTQLWCEAKWRLSPFILRQFCGVGAVDEVVRREPLPPFTSWHVPGDDMAPAWIAGGLNRDHLHRGLYFGDTFAEPSPDSSEVKDLFAHLVHYRQRAAGHDIDEAHPTLWMAKPVAPPARPESISVDHHDPYLVNYRGAPIALRIGDKPGAVARAGAVQSDDCRLRAIGRPGAHPGPGEAASEVVEALKAAAFDDCSVAVQLPGPEGDMAEALRSVHVGDPETPVLEAYEGERLVIRLIQGAQEVQHTFNVAGLPFMRNIDQVFPSGMQPLGQSPLRRAEAGIRGACLEAGRAGRPDEYARWRDSAALPPGLGFDWPGYEALLAECDNLEGFTFAQEIGISEHFEMKGSLRSDVIASPEKVPPAARVETGDLPEGSSDYLYNFGTVDALWNGAWGLLRIYRDDTVPDPATVAAFNAVTPGLSGTGVPIVSRLGPRLRALEAAGRPGQAPETGTSDISCPRPPTGGTQRIIEAALVAVETRAAFDAPGTDYGAGRYDPDGLMLALLSPQALGLDDAPRDPATGEARLPRAAVLAAVRAAYDRPVPMTLRVNAGDCVRLHFVNALEADATGGLRDVLGDARLPPIVPLNADPAYQAPGHGETVGTLDRPGAGPMGGLRPSAALAIGVGLPGMDLARDVPLAFGYGRPALRPGDADSVTAGPPLLFYAGRMRIDLAGDADREALVAEIGQAAHDALAATAAPWLLRDGAGFPAVAGDPGFVLVRTEGDAPGVVTILGQRHDLLMSPAGDASALAMAVEGLFLDGTDAAYDALAGAACAGAASCRSADEVRDALSTALRTATADALDSRVHWIPYAFGAVPLRSLSDVISHAPHGLFGAIDVVPRGWTADDGTGQELTCTGGDHGTYEVCAASHRAGPPRDGDPMVFTATRGKATEPTREFVLYYQDGLNLWDRASRIEWRWDRPDGQLVGGTGGRLRMVPDCPVCDDSYDLGEKGVNYRAPGLTLAGIGPDGRVEESDDLNAVVFAPDHLLDQPAPIRLRACVGEQVVIRLVHPGGRARQRAFVMNGWSYDDLFPGFGFPQSTLLAPGKSATAWLWPRAEEGTYLWHDGATQIRRGGVWGLIDVSSGPGCGG
jgi:manganese oxidase